MKEIYPNFIVDQERGLIPNIKLPEDYLERVLLFYKQARKQNVLEIVRTLNKLEDSILLKWDDKKGLTSISIGLAGGLDLNEDGIPSFQEHNLYTSKSLIAGAIAQQYVDELLKTK